MLQHKTIRLPIGRLHDFHRLLALPFSGSQQIPLPSLLGRFLWFADLSRTHNLDGVLTLGWRFTNSEDTDDPWSRRFMQFKYSAPRTAAGASRCLNYALAHIDWKGQNVGITAALHSRDSTLDPDGSLAQVAETIAQRRGFSFQPNLLCKKPHRPLKHIGGLDARVREVDGKYHCIREIDSPIILVIDDLVTNGSTLSEIARAIKFKNPDTRIVGVALAKNEDRNFVRQNANKEISNDHIPTSYVGLWENI